jgi:hypothetical protein
MRAVLFPGSGDVGLADLRPAIVVARAHPLGDQS